MPKKYFQRVDSLVKKRAKREDSLVKERAKKNGQKPEVKIKSVDRK